MVRFLNYSLSLLVRLRFVDALLKKYFERESVAQAFEKEAKNAVADRSTLLEPAHHEFYPGYETRIEVGSSRWSPGSGDEHQRSAPPSEQGLDPRYYAGFLRAESARIAGAIMPRPA